MPETKIRFFISGLKGEVSSDTSYWGLPLLNKPNLPSLSPSPQRNLSEKEVAVGDYLSAAKQFLCLNDFAILKKGVSGQGYEAFHVGMIRFLDLSLEKHGAFYHPVKVTLRFNGDCVCRFVLNGAVSKQGLDLLEGEYARISCLNKKYPQGFLPKVYGSRFVETVKGRIGFFLGEWLEGFKEFHLTEESGRRQMVVWDSDGTCSYIDLEGSYEIYRQVARILTFYYDLETFEQIFPWHHAAGDFIVRRSDGNCSVRLITARGYQNLTDFDGTQPEGRVLILPALLLFFLNLTLRIRLDRLDGTGEVVLVDQRVLPFVVDGFLEGLNDLSGRVDYGGVAEAFLEFVKQFSCEQLLEIMGNVLDAYPVAGSEVELIRKDLEPHFKKVAVCLKTL